MVNDIDVLEFLVLNKDEILKDIRPEIRRFLASESLFNGVFRLAYDLALEEFILSTLRFYLAKHFNLQFEQISIIITVESLKKYTKDLFFNKENYSINLSDLIMED